MDDRQKLAGAIALGYVLGRTKKGGAALRAYMWATGNTGGPQVISAAKGVAQGQAVQGLLGQVTGPLRTALTDMAMAQATSRMTGLTKSLTDRTAKLTDTVSSTAEDVTDTVGEPVKKAAKKAEPVRKAAKKADRPKAEKKEDEEVEQQEPVEQQPEDHPDTEEGYEDDEGDLEVEDGEEPEDLEVEDGEEPEPVKKTRRARRPKTEESEDEDA